jgi:protoheme IX farnesyltransferase
MIDAPSRPGPWLRLLAVSAAFSVGVVVATGEWARSHQASVLTALALLAAVWLCARYGHPDGRGLRIASATALGLFVVQIAVGGAVALGGEGGAAGAVHVALGAVSLAASVVAAALAFRPGVEAPNGSWRDYVTLTKPRIMSLLLITGAGGLVLGAEGLPSLGLTLATIGGLALACGGASALNHVLDRDIDQLMGSRTEARPVASGRVAPARALEFGLALLAASFVVLTSFANVLAAVLALVGGAFYVLVYTRWLKRSTPQNIVIGGAAGAIPPVVGWAAATGNLTLPALFLFLIVFFWTPPHFWALALLIRRNYEAAGVPMLPVVRGDAETARAILRYTVVLVAITLLPVFAQTVGVLYLASAVVLGAAFLALAEALRRSTTPARARRLFSYSLAYLALLFVALALDPLLV